MMAFVDTNLKSLPIIHPTNRQLHTKASHNLLRDDRDSFSTQLIRYHLVFLRKIDDRGELFYEETFIENAIRRYEHIWIPFVHTVTTKDDCIKDEDLAPPLGKNLRAIIYSPIYRN